MKPILSLNVCLGLNKVDRTCHLIGDEPQKVFREVFGRDATRPELDNLVQNTRIGNKSFIDSDYASAAEYLRTTPQGQQLRQQQLMDKQKGEQSAFLGRYTTGLDSARTALNSELGLDGLRTATQTAGQTARDVSRQVQDVAPTQQAIAKQVGISAPRLQSRIAAKTTEMAPALEAARRSLEDSTAAQAFGETQYTERLKEFTKPYELEASMLSESLAREFTGFTQQMSNELTLTLQKLQQGHELTMAEVQRANTLADQEASFEKQKQLLSLQSNTDISQQQQMKLLGLGTYYQAPKTGSSGSSYNPAGI